MINGEWRINVALKIKEEWKTNVGRINAEQTRTITHQMQHITLLLHILYLKLTSRQCKGDPQLPIHHELLFRSFLPLLPHQPLRNMEPKSGNVRGNEWNVHHLHHRKHLLHPSVNPNEHRGRWTSMRITMIRERRTRKVELFLVPVPAQLLHQGK
jgi:hypothetical protein